MEAGAVAFICGFVAGAVCRHVFGGGTTVAVSQSVEHEHFHPAETESGNTDGDGDDPDDDEPWRESLKPRPDDDFTAS